MVMVSESMYVMAFNKPMTSYFPCPEVSGRSSVEKAEAEASVKAAVEALMGERGDMQPRQQSGTDASVEEEEESGVAAVVVEEGIATAVVEEVKKPADELGKTWLELIDTKL